MSRIGKTPISIPEGVTVSITNRHVEVKGPKGTLELDYPTPVEITQENNEVVVTPRDAEDKFSRSLWGTYQRLVQNLVTGVTEGFSRVLEFKGVGWRMAVKGKVLEMNVGYSHQIDFKIPEGIDVTVEKSVITVSGINKQQVGQIAAEIRSVRKPEPYKGKGIKYQEEVIRRKAGKQAKAA